MAQNQNLLTMLNRCSMLLNLGTIAAIMGAGTSLWLGAAAIAPATVQAQVSPMAVSVVRQPGESYARLLERAEAAARAIAQQQFARAGADTVNITVLGEYRGQIAPLLTLAANRDEWRRYANSDQLMTYYQTARSLLLIDGVPATTTATAQPPANTPAAAPSSTGTTGTQPTTPSTMPTVPVSGTPTGGDSITPEQPDVPINIPAAPTGQIGLPRSILR